MSAIPKFYGTGGVILEFILGIALAMILRRTKYDAALGASILAIGLTLIPFCMFGYSTRLTSTAPAAVIVVAGAILSEPIWRKHALSRRLAILGDASYAIYLSHLMVISPIFAALGVNLTSAVLTPIVATLVGIALHLWVERPIMSFRLRPIERDRIERAQL